MKATSRIAISNDSLFPEIRQLLSSGHTVTFLVRGNSMNPFLVDRRDKVILAPLRGTPRPGDLLLAYQSDRQRYVLHRLVDIKNDKYILQGDGNIKEVEIISGENLIGKVTSVIRKEKIHTVSSFRWKVYSAVWTRLLPLRRGILAVWRRI